MVPGQLFPQTSELLPGVIPGLPMSLPFGVPPVMTSSAGAMAQWNGTANATEILAAFSNMTATQIFGTVQTVILTALMRQYMFNDFFAGGVGLMLIGFLGTKMRGIWGSLMTRLLREKGSVRVRIEHCSEVFQWVQDWLKLHSSISSTNYEVFCRWENENTNECCDHGYQNEEQRPKVGLTAEFKDAQRIMFKGEVVWVQSSSQLKKGGGGGNGEELLAMLKAPMKDDLVLSSSSKKLLEELVQEAMDMHYKKMDQTGNRETRVYRWSCDEMYWVDAGARKARPLESVILDCNPEGMISDARRFLASAAWYADRGIPHRRGYLLHGPPGCGKTSLIKVLAGELKLDVALISLASKNLNDDVLQSAMGRLPFRCIFVLEDVDAAFGQEKAGNAGGAAGSSAAEDDDASGPGFSARVGTGSHSLSFSGLLNALDGITAQEGSVVVMTTNHLEKLDPALIRPGRVDMRLFLGLATVKQACGIFRRFYPEATAEQEAQVAAALPDKLLSPASLQGLFLEHRDDLQGMLDTLPDFVSEAQASAAGKKAPSSPAKKDEKDSKAVDFDLPEAEDKPAECGEGKRKREKQRKKNRDKKDQMRNAEMSLSVQDKNVSVSEGENECEAPKGSAGNEELDAPQEKAAGEQSDSSQASEGWEQVVKGQRKGPGKK